MRKISLFFGVWVSVFLMVVFIALNVPAVKGSGTIYIRADGSIDPPETPISCIDNVTYTFTNNIYDSIVVQKDHIIINGAGHTVQGAGIITLSGTGIDLSGRVDVTVQNVQIKAFDYGIRLNYSYGNTVSGNNITANNGDGVFLFASSGNTISDNNIARNSGRDGVRLLDSFGNTVSGNNIAYSASGVRFEYSSGNTVSGNNIAYNGYSVELLYSSNNGFYHNNVRNKAYVTAGYANTWDNGYPSGGNYWSDYTGTDHFHGPYQNIWGSDFIIDTAYEIDPNNIDHYPTMIPYKIAPPTIIIASPRNEIYAVNTRIRLNFTVDEFPRWIGYSLNGQPNVTITGNTTLPTLSDGHYYVIVYANNTFGNMGASDARHFAVDTTPPTANAGDDQTVGEDTLVTLDASASTDENGIAIYAWTFTDVTNLMLTGEKPTYTFNTLGVYTITLHIRDAAGNWATDTVVITVLDVTKPVSNAGQDQTVNVGVAVSFDAGSSTDNVGIVSYEWDFGDGATGTGITTTHTYATLGTYTVTLTVKDAAGNTATDIITITVRPPEAFSTWIIGGAIIATGIAVAATLLWKQRKPT